MNKEIVALNENIEFLVSQRKLLEPYLEFLGKYLLEEAQKEPMGVKLAFEMFKFITEYHTNSTILIMKAGEVLNECRKRK